MLSLFYRACTDSDMRTSRGQGEEGSEVALVLRGADGGERGLQARRSRCS